MVRSLYRLREKVAIFEAGLDDVTVELVKAAAEAQREGEGGTLFFVTREQKDGEDSLVFAEVGAEGIIGGRAIDVAPLYPEQHARFNSGGRVGSGWRVVDRDVILALVACDEGPASVEDAPAPRRWWQRWRC